MATPLSTWGLSPLDYDAALSLPYSAIVINNLLLTASYGTGPQKLLGFTKLMADGKFASKRSDFQNV